MIYRLHGGGYQGIKLQLFSAVFWIDLCRVAVNDLHCLINNVKTTKDIGYSVTGTIIAQQI